MGDNPATSSKNYQESVGNIITVPKADTTCPETAAILQGPSTRQFSKIDKAQDCLHQGEEPGQILKWNNGSQAEEGETRECSENLLLGYPFLKDILALLEDEDESRRDIVSTDPHVNVQCQYAHRKNLSYSKHIENLTHAPGKGNQIDGNSDLDGASSLSSRQNFEPQEIASNKMNPSLPYHNEPRLSPHPCPFDDGDRRIVIPIINLFDSESSETHLNKLNTFLSSPLKIDFTPPFHRIHPKSAREHVRITHYLKIHKLPFFTHPIPSQTRRYLTFELISGPGTRINVAKLLLDAGFKTIGPITEHKYSVCLRKRLKYKLQLSDIEKEEEFLKLDQINGMNVEVSLFSPGFPDQCWRCQRFGHIGQYCRMPTRCPQCAQAHLIRDCTLAEDQDYSCCNCGGRHNSGYLHCPIYASAHAEQAVRDFHQEMKQLRIRCPKK